VRTKSRPWELIVPTVLETTDLGLAHHVLSTAYGKLAISGVRGPLRVRLSRADLGLAELHHNTFTMQLTASGPPLGRFSIGRLVGGVMCHRMGRLETRQATPGEVFVASNPDQELHATLCHSEGEFAILRPELLASVAATDPGRTVRPLRFTGHRPLSPAAAAVWNSTFDFVRDNVTDVPIAHASLLHGAAARLLAATALAVFPNTSVHEPTAEERRDAHPAALRRAVSFIDDNAHVDIGAADIAAAAHVTIRTLQLAFRRHLDTTPMAYLRRVRLEHAHRDLLRAEPGTATVSAVAARWGILGHSRFTALYRAAYGVTPSSTLRRSR
jgi:AraC-like DNA-binding protein